jgi:glycine/D-amino acid oxidase-like deaminating enzyme
MEKSRLIALMNSTSPNIDGLIMAAGHEGDGIAPSPITGRLIANWITGGLPESRLDRFRLKGFHTTHHFEKSP